MASKAQHQEVLPPQPAAQSNGHGGKREGAGRKEGSPNKIGMNIRGMILDALNTLGGENYFVALAVTQPAAFAQLVGKVLPTTVVFTPGDNDGVREIRRSVVVLPPKK